MKHLIIIMTLLTSLSLVATTFVTTTPASATTDEQWTEKAETQVTRSLAIPTLANATTDEEFADKARTWLLENPEVLLDAMQVLETRRAEAAVADDIEKITANSNDLFNNPADGYVGTGEAVAVEFFDYRCGYCKRQLPAIEAFNAAHPDKRVILKEFPILGPDSEFAARVALATKKTHGNEGYVTLHNALLAHEGQLDEATIISILAKNDFDVAEITKSVDDAVITRQIEDNRNLAERLGINGTPGFVFKTEISRGLLSLAALEDGTGTE